MIPYRQYQTYSSCCNMCWLLKHALPCLQIYCICDAAQLSAGGQLCAQQGTLRCLCVLAACRLQGALLWHSSRASARPSHPQPLPELILRKVKQCDWSGLGVSCQTHFCCQAFGSVNSHFKRRMSQTDMWAGVPPVLCVSLFGYCTSACNCQGSMCGDGCCK